MHIHPVDPAFIAQSTTWRSDVCWFSPSEAPFRIYGLCKTAADTWRRMPEDVANATSAGVAGLNKNTAGGRIRFMTDSSFIAVRAKPLNAGGMSNMAMAGVAGCDIYCGTDFIGAIQPKDMSGETYEAQIQLPEGEKQITINLPLYNGLAEIAIGLMSGAKLGECTPYAIEQPVVFYGSSITQGACATRPGTCYQAYLSRWLDMNYVNLGFAGSCKAEQPMIDYLASLNMRAFVLDYDHNATSIQYLEMTHEKLFRAVRAKQPDLPVLLISRPNVDRDPEEAARRFAVIERTYKNAVDAGDKNVRIINGADLFAGPDRRECTVDSCHPTDLGFYRMATVIRPVLAEMLGL